MIMELAPINKDATESSETLKFVFKKNKVYMVVLAPNLSIRTIRFFFLIRIF